MKRTAQTLLTAAIFATALGSTAQSQMRQPVQAVDDPIFDLQTNYAGVYGPPPTQRTTEELTETTTYTTTNQFVASIPVYPDSELPVTTDLIPEPAYGPPRTAFSGDMNWDAIADARDLTLIKRAALVGRDNFDGWYDMADVNHNGDVNEEDVHFFMEETLGIPKKEAAVTTTPAVTTAAEMTTTLISTTTMVTFPLYGPPPVTTVSEMTAPPETTRDTDIPVPLYGPPSMMQ